MFRHFHSSLALPLVTSVTTSGQNLPSLLSVPVRRTAVLDRFPTWNSPIRCPCREHKYVNSTLTAEASAVGPPSITFLSQSSCDGVTKGFDDRDVAARAIPYAIHQSTR